jgi:hypothetical protein
MQGFNGENFVVANVIIGNVYFLTIDTVGYVYLQIQVIIDIIYIK